MDMLERRFQQVERLPLGKNLGFAGGYNQALQQIDAEFFLLLNSDVEVTPNWIAPLLEIMQTDKTIAAVQPKVLSLDQRDHFEHAGAAGGFLDKDAFPFCRGRVFELFEKDNGQYDQSMEIFWATGACMLVRAQAFREFDGFDAGFFAHMEEIDLCWRWKNAGWRIMVEPASVVYHLGGGTLPYSNPRKTFLNFRNSLYMITKNHRNGLLFTKLLKRLWLDGIAGIKFLLGGGISHSWQIVKAHYHFYTHLPALLEIRRKLVNKTKEANNKGLYRKSIVAARFLHGKKKFSELDQADFS